jgi:poly-gamma-glutamate synthesis protein (capsule biosynthesis protein)
MGLAILGTILGALYFAFPNQRSEAALVPVRAIAGIFERTREARLLFVGDMMFDRTVRSIANKNGYDPLFTNVRELFASYDFVMGNLEGPVTSFPSKSAGTVPGDANNMRFTFSHAVPKALEDAGIDMVSLANNHILDFGLEGFLETTTALEQTKVGWVGSPYEKKDNLKYVAHDDILFAIVSYNQFLGPGLTSTIDTIREAEARADIVVVFTHWGEEYVTSASSYIRSLAHALVDAGADLVVGTHPHVVQPYELYAGKRIYYSLGNFIFDQYWKKEVRCGIALGVHVVKRGDSVKYVYSETETSFTRGGEVVLGCS